MRDNEYPESSLPRSVRIVNGTIARDEDWVKYDVRITHLEEDHHELEFCSGSLIGEK